MNNTRQKLFSNDRIQLFVHNAIQDNPNPKFYKENLEKFSEVQTPSEKNQPRQVLLVIIEKKDSQIRDLKRKLKVFQTDLIQNKQKLDSTIYELEYFKRKISQEFQRSKNLESQIEITNTKIIQMIKKLNCVKKLKNPLQIKNNCEDLGKITQKIQGLIQNQKSIHQIDMCCLDYLQKEVIKVAAIIESAFSIKKMKKEKLLNQPSQIRNNIFPF